MNDGIQMYLLCRKMSPRLVEPTGLGFYCGFVLTHTSDKTTSAEFCYGTVLIGSTVGLEAREVERTI